MKIRCMLWALLALSSIWLSACTTDGQNTPGPTFTAAPLPAETQHLASLKLTNTPAPLEIAPNDATLAPDVSAQETPLPYTTATIQKLAPNCLRPVDYEWMVNRYVTSQGKTDLKEVWEDFDQKNPVYNLMSSLTDVSNTYSLAMTYSKMLLIGEYKISINRPGAVGYAHCAVFIYMGGDDPEVGVGVLDATLNETWSGYAYGSVRSEPELRAYIRQRVGKAVIVRYHVAQDSRDAGFVRTGFFSPVMKLLWENSYYTRFHDNPDMLRDSVQSPRGPSMQSLMTVLSGWSDTEVGVFLDYVIDPIL